MTASQAFKAAHATAKATRNSFVSYRAAFAQALKVMCAQVSTAVFAVGQKVCCTYGKVTGTITKIVKDDFMGFPTFFVESEVLRLGSQDTMMLKTTSYCISHPSNWSIVA